MNLTNPYRNVVMFIGEKNSGKTALFTNITSTWTEKVCGVKTDLSRRKKRKPCKLLNIALLMFKLHLPNCQ